MLLVPEGKQLTPALPLMTRRRAAIPSGSKGSLLADREENQLRHLSAWRRMALGTMTTVSALLQLQADRVGEEPAPPRSLQPLPRSLQ